MRRTSSRRAAPRPRHRAHAPRHARGRPDRELIGRLAVDARMTAAHRPRRARTRGHTQPAVATSRPYRLLEPECNASSSGAGIGAGDDGVVRDGWAGPFVGAAPGFHTIAATRSTATATIATSARAPVGDRWSCTVARAAAPERRSTVGRRWRGRRGGAAGSTCVASGGGAATAATTVRSSSGRRSASDISAADANRALGSCCIERSITAVRLSSSSGRLVCSDSGGVATTACATAAGVSPANGLCPTAASYSTTPSEYRSLRFVAGSPSSRSGAMYATLPMTSPVAVWSAPLTLLAMPKSAICIEPSAPIRRFDGLMSRCTIPSSWAACKPASASESESADAVLAHPALRELRRDRDAREAFHDDERITVVLVRVEDRHDVAIRDASGGVGLVGKPPPHDRVRGERRRQHFDRNRPLEPVVPRPLHGRHAPAPDHTLQFVAAGEVGRRSGCAGSGYTRSRHDELVLRMTAGTGAGAPAALAQGYPKGRA